MRRPRLDKTYMTKKRTEPRRRTITPASGRDRALRESEERFRALIELSTDWYWEQDAQFRFVRFSGDFGKLEISKAQWMGRRRWEVETIGLTDEQWAEHRRQLDAHQPFRDLEYQRVLDTGEARWINVSGLPIFDPNGKFIGYRGVGRDITERKRAEELIQSRIQLQQLAAHINQVREEQRAKFARELHDVLGGMLTSMKMDVTRIMRRAEEPELLEIAKGLLVLTQETIDSVRAISEELRPSILDHLGLTATLERELNDFSIRYNIDCHLEVKGPFVEITRERAIGIYRILQEALTNIARHAEATSVSVRMNWRDRELSMEVIDNGRGIDHQTQKVNSLGLLSMTERARELGGTLDVGSCSAGGTRLQMVVPYDPTGSNEL